MTKSVKNDLIFHSRSLSTFIKNIYVFQRAVVDREWIKEKQAAVKDFEVSLSGSSFQPQSSLGYIKQKS